MHALCMSEPSAYLSAKAQLEWAPSFANAAAVLALAGIVGNVPNPDTALAALTPSLSLFGIGLLLGCVALHVSLAVARSITRMSTHADSLELMAEVGRKIQTFESQGWPEDTKVTRKLRSQFADVQKTVEAMGVELQVITRLQNWPPRLNIAALTCCGLGFCILLIGHSLGMLWLEPR